jgi:hypothetical protein
MIVGTNGTIFSYLERCRIIITELVVSESGWCQQEESRRVKASDWELSLAATTKKFILVLTVEMSFKHNICLCISN